MFSAQHTARSSASYILCSCAAQCTQATLAGRVRSASGGSNHVHGRRAWHCSRTQFSCRWRRTCASDPYRSSFARAVTNIDDRSCIHAPDTVSQLVRDGLGARPKITGGQTGRVLSGGEIDRDLFNGKRGNALLCTGARPAGEMSRDVARCGETGEKNDLEHQLGIQASSFKVRRRRRR